MDKYVRMRMDSTLVVVVVVGIVNRYDLRVLFFPDFFPPVVRYVSVFFLFSFSFLGRSSS